MIPTEKLIELLNTESSLETILEQIPNVDFVSYLEACMKKQNMEKKDVIHQTNMQENYAYQICSGAKKGSKDKIVQLALAMHLDLHDTDNLLSLSDNGKLYAKVKKDSILIYAISHRYTVQKTNELLFAHGLDILE